MKLSSKTGAARLVGKVRPVFTVVSEELNGRDDHPTGGGDRASASLIDQIGREGARRMPAEALQAARSTPTSPASSPSTTRPAADWW
ncbi:hypothetical protein [Pseudonocardia asaccharolytica]|uniref:hypothetical protein n=1 Tax=Pseudonocardia asaccharolytica TaxID=54010 RepID=UPI001B7F7D1C